MKPNKSVDHCVSPAAAAGETRVTLNVPLRFRPGGGALARWRAPQQTTGTDPPCGMAAQRAVMRTVAEYLGDARCKFRKNQERRKTHV